MIEKLKKEIMDCEINKKYDLPEEMRRQYTAYSIDTDRDYGYFWTLTCGGTWGHGAIFPRGKRIGEVGFYKTVKGCKKSLIDKLSGYSL